MKKRVKKRNAESEAVYKERNNISLADKMGKIEELKKTTKKHAITRREFALSHKFFRFFQGSFIFNFIYYSFIFVFVFFSNNSVNGHLLHAIVDSFWEIQGIIT